MLPLTWQRIHIFNIAWQYRMDYAEFDGVTVSNLIICFFRVNATKETPSNSAIGIGNFGTVFSLGPCYIKLKLFLPKRARIIEMRDEYELEYGLPPG